MSVKEFVLFSATLKTSSALTVFSDFFCPFLLYKQSSKVRSRRIEKKEMALFIQCFTKEKFMKKHYK